MSKIKKLSNSFSTGGGGAHFEAHVQALFVVLMATGGRPPCLPRWPIAKVKLQGKIDGFGTDDLVVIVENPSSKEQRKLLGQVKHSIAITQGNVLFGEVIQAAWNDYNNSDVFTKDKDIIALITGPLSETDQRNVLWLLDQARHTENVDEFFTHVCGVNFSPSKSADKLSAIQHHLKAANSGNEVTKDELYEFLNHFHLLSCDLGNESGVNLSLLHSHISQFQQNDPQMIWSRVVDIVQTWNQNAGTITPRNLPEDLLEAFKHKPVKEMPDAFKEPQNRPKTDWTQHRDATYLALAVLIGAWNEKTKCDLDTITKLLGIRYDEWLNKARELLHNPDSPLSLKNGIWKVVNRSELWNQLGSRILDQNLDTFRSLAVSALNEPDPAFELPAAEPLLASIQGNVLECSHIMRQGIAEGLAMMSNKPEACSNCSQGKVKNICSMILHEILSDADWILRGSLNNLLPTLAEVHPSKFLYAVENALNRTPCPFDKQFAQEGGITGGIYLTGLIRALEGLAWEEQYLVRVCSILCELANHDSGDLWSNRPFNSLTTILLPWFPQTLASVDKREVAIKTVLNEWPDIAWNLIIQLLPGQHQTSSGSHKPNWRLKIPENMENVVTDEEYWQQSSFYAELAVATAGDEIDRLSELIDYVDLLPQPAFDQFIKILTSPPVSTFPEEQRLRLWNCLTNFTIKHRQFSDSQRELPKELINIINIIEQVSEQLVPTEPFYRYQYLFTDSDFKFHEVNGYWQTQRQKPDARRKKALSEIKQKNGIDGVIKFSKTVASPKQVGLALGLITDDDVEQTLLPRFLDTADNKRKALVSGFIWQRYHIKNWEWCDKIDKSGWTSAQIGQFLACLPFAKKVWVGASKWLQEDEGEYWTRADTDAYQTDSDMTVAVEKLIEHGRPHAAIQCLVRMLHAGQKIDVDQCVRTLIAALSSSEPTYTKDRYDIVELIKFLQADSSVSQNDQHRVEWRYLDLLNQHQGAAPFFLENKLANDPEFFVEVIQSIYRSKREDQRSNKPTKKSRAMAEKARQLMRKWETPPGTQNDGTFNDKRFTKWLERVKLLSKESGYLEVALVNIGKVLIHAPADPDGLWIHRAVAAALNDRAADKLRGGFRMGKYNSRSAHFVDPTGKPEKELAEKFRKKAEEIENAGYHRFTVVLRDLADRYDQEAERIIAEHKPDDE